jgi:cytochrome c-type biogenesis protein CcmH/NrfF
VKLFATLAAALVLWTPTPAFADPQDISNDIAREMVSPFCPGVTLHDCPSDAARALRTRIAGWAETGMTKDQIWERLEHEFDGEIRATPSASGSGLWAWVLPIAVALAGAALAIVLALRWSRRPSPETESDTNVTPEQRRRLDGELAALRDQRG